MKHTRRCSECGGTNIRTTTVSAGGGHAPDLLPGTHSWWHTGSLEIYICLGCGHFQFFVPSDELSDVAESKNFTRPA